MPLSPVSERFTSSGPGGLLRRSTGEPRRQLAALVLGQRRRTAWRHRAIREARLDTGPRRADLRRRREAQPVCCACRAVTAGTGPRDDGLRIAIPRHRGGAVTGGGGAAAGGEERDQQEQGSARRAASRVHAPTCSRAAQIDHRSSAGGRHPALHGGRVGARVRRDDAGRACSVRRRWGAPLGARQAQAFRVDDGALRASASGVPWNPSPRLRPLLPRSSTSPT